MIIRQSPRARSDEPRALSNLLLSVISTKIYTYWQNTSTFFSFIVGQLHDIQRYVNFIE